HRLIFSVSKVEPEEPTGMNIQKLFDLAGRTALVTGGNSGLGEAIARALGLAGARVVLAARREAELRSAAERMRADGIDAAWHVCDLGDTSRIPDEASAIAGQRGGIDILVNAAGVNLRQAFGDVT